jgi:uncharacterized protein (DUF1501 family)
MTLDRREFLKAAAGALALPCVPARAPRPRQPVLVVVFLRGGQDALHVLVPCADPRYAALRPTLALARDGANAALPLDGRFWLHPALAPLQPLWAAGRLAPIVNVGSPHPTRSHFDAQDFMERAAPGARHVRDGWLNRYLAATARKDEPPLRAVAMQNLLPRSLRGAHPVLAVPELRGADPVADDALAQLYAAGGGDAVLRAGSSTVAVLRHYQEVVARTRDAARVPYPAGPLGERLQRIARLAKAGEPVELAAADHPGWDHHANQADTCARMLAHLAGSLAAFARDLGPDLDRTLVLVVTEFGRTCRENGNGGTDHGHGGVALALGGGVRGGTVHGRWTGLAERELWEGRDLPVTTDFRDVFAEVLREHLRWDLPRGFFPEYTLSAPLGFLRGA